jgi:hypothetical protein
VPRATASLGSAFRLAIVLLIISFGGLRPIGDKISVPLRRSGARRRLLLERVKEVYGFLVPNCVNRSMRVAIVRLDDLQYSRTETFPRLRRRSGAAELRYAERDGSQNRA